MIQAIKPNNQASNQAIKIQLDSPLKPSVVICYQASSQAEARGWLGLFVSKSGKRVLPLYPLYMVSSVDVDYKLLLHSTLEA
jgi:hypothetical protein